MDTKNDIDPEVVLRNWRTKILNGFLIIVAIAAGAGTVVSILDAVSHPNQWPAAILFSILESVMIVLAVFRGINYRVRAWGVLLVPYTVGVINLASFGLGSGGRLYLLAVPIGGLILIGVQSGIIMSVLVALTMAAFTLLAKLGLLQEWLVTDRNSLLTSDWFSESMDTWIMTLTIMALLILFYRFQESLIRKTRRAQAEVLHAHALLEEQNVTLEQKIQERTSELQASNHSLEKRNAALGIINSISQAMTKTLDVKTMTRLVGDKMREIFDVDSAMIMLLDKHTNLIHVTYEYDKNEGGYIDYVEPFPLGTGLSSKVIAAGQPLMAGTLEEEIANGAYFPPEIIEKGSGFYSQSWLGVPIVASDRVLGLVALADGRPNAFNQNHMHLLQTLSSNLGAAIENARLFDETQRLLKETEQHASELQLINSVQTGLASQLDFQAVINLVGDMIRSIFNSQNMSIGIYDHSAGTVHYAYAVQKGNRLHFEPMPFSGVATHLIKTRQPLVFNENTRQKMKELGSHWADADMPMSVIYVPLVVGETATGVISIYDFDHEHAFSE